MQNYPPPQPTNPTTPKKSFVKEYWYVFFFIFIFLVVAIAQIMRILTPPSVPTQENTWGGITPGHSSLNSVVDILGEPIGSTIVNGQTTLEYSSSYKTLPNQVIINPNTQRVAFIKEYVAYKENQQLNDYINKLGEYDFALTDKLSGDSSLAYVFLTKGVVILAHKKTGLVEQKWYFEPLSEEVFLQSWG